MKITRKLIERMIREELQKEVAANADPAAKFNELVAGTELAAAQEEPARVENNKFYTGFYTALGGAHLTKPVNSHLANFPGDAVSGLVDRLGHDVRAIAVDPSSGEFYISLDMAPGAGLEEGKSTPITKKLIQEMVKEELEGAGMVPSAMEEVTRLIEIVTAVDNSGSPSALRIEYMPTIVNAVDALRARLGAGA